LALPQFIQLPTHSDLLYPLPPMSTTIEIQSLTKHYKAFTGGLTTAVDRISLTINSGDLFFLLGPSGCGKTTLLRMIAGFIEPSHGRVLFNGRDVTHTPPNKRNTGMVFQSYALWPHMSVAQNVAFGLSVRKIPKPIRDQRTLDALRSVHMDAYASRKPNQLSGGQQQRVALARALVVRPDVLLLDEPLSNLDAKLRLEMRSEIKRICKESGLTTVYVTHDQKEALSMADQMAVLDMGVIAQIGPPRDLYLRPNSRFVADFLGETNFLTAQITARSTNRLELRSPAGPLLSSAFDPDTTPNKGAVTCSIRPEAWKLAPLHSPSALRGRVVESIYLGEIAQHQIDLLAPDTNTPAQRVKLFELHPTNASLSRRDIALTIDPDDVVIVRD